MTEPLRLTLDEWKLVLYNLKEMNQEVEIIWLETGNEWVLCNDCDLYEDGYETEKEARERLENIERQLS